jgi:hypothetical protein
MTPKCGHQSPITGGGVGRGAGYVGGDRVRKKRTREPDPLVGAFDLTEQLAAREGDQIARSKAHEAEDVRSKRETSV